MFLQMGDLTGVHDALESVQDLLESVLDALKSVREPDTLVTYFDRFGIGSG